ncbi:DUF58 domain-containing protein [Kitasatospora purpeofusca]|uniref:DUF58 domain-containing protein n=1 Tax=Kitasatospora purpeofusca TaxID=67352 RepID=UPI0022526F7F|nr:DUF58 domain-containing protein [Kitasatospora purpeofusca]MCX4752277.1 DUF58 domain-containing protein [Kitasatospora purpeofusca]WSR31860.1 DUF58 domain-containing protein [Kitasatospora purpeofusca]WSR39887.1 DUF58 domain-containing protein [Kitasatospora purpeofusca]
MGPSGEPSGLRAGLRGLTTRGRSFLAAGLTAVVCSYLLGQDALLRVGVLLAALPLAAALLLANTRYRVASGRRLNPHRSVAGQEARVHLRVDNVSRVPTGLLLLEDKVPYVLGPRPRFVLDRVEPRGHREVSYRVRSDLRGRYPLGPLQLRLSDPFGMCELNRSFAASDVLTVVPQVLPLPFVRLTGEWAGQGESHTRSLALAGDDDVILREYRAGDDLRRVHWKSTARYGELMVRREEQPRRARATVLLDTRETGHRGSGPASSFEWAVACAASVCVHLLERGYQTRLLTDTGHAVPGVQGDSGHTAADTSGVILDALAVVDLSDGAGLSRAEEPLRAGGEGLLVAVLGELDEEQTARLARLRGRTGGAVVLLLDTGTWAGLRLLSPETGGEEFRERARRLREAGWTVLTVRAGDSLPDLWRAADRPESSAPYREEAGA